MKQRISLGQQRYVIRSYVDNDLVSRSIVYDLDELGVLLHSHWATCVDVILHHTAYPLAKRIHLDELRLIINLPLDNKRVLFEEEIFDGTIH